MRCPPWRCASAVEASVVSVRMIADNNRAMGFMGESPADVLSAMSGTRVAFWFRHRHSQRQHPIDTAATGSDATFSAQ
jgi:hypothetical protein